MKQQFSTEVNKLQQYFTQLGQHVSLEIDQATGAFVQHDKQAAQQLIEEQTINGQEDWLEKKVLQLMLLQQPVAADFRRVISILKASSDLERIGDHAISIAKETLRMQGSTRLPLIEAEIKKMTDHVQWMLQAVLTAYLKNDPVEAQQAAEMDDYLDAEYRHLREVITESIDQGKNIAVACMSYFTVIRLLERIGDHTVNIAKWVVYNHSGEIVSLE